MPAPFVPVAVLENFRLPHDGQDVIFVQNQKFFAVNLHRNTRVFFEKDTIPFRNLRESSGPIRQQSAVAHGEHATFAHPGMVNLRQYKSGGTVFPGQRFDYHASTQWDELHLKSLPNIR
jgi:hypothetical protein